jgi:pyruvyl transferase EpsO
VTTRLIARIRRCVEGTVRPLLLRGPFALLDFPSHSNVGDSAIWLGELACLAALGVNRLCYSCDLATYDRGDLARRVRGGTILLHGGGNIGDLWEPYERFREMVVASFPDNPIVQLPQTVHFRGRSALARARAVFNAHPDFTLLVRDRHSLEIARNEFRVPAFLCPDSAFCLGAIRRSVPSTQPLIWLARTDCEAGDFESRINEGGWRAAIPQVLATSRFDWIGEPPTRVRELSRALGHRLTKRPRGRTRALRAMTSATYAPLARERLNRGCRLLSKAEVVITDRLHGHILCLLLGIPHILLDDRYGKVRSFYETWTSESELTRWAESPTEAAALVAGRISRANDVVR